MKDKKREILEDVWNAGTVETKEAGKDTIDQACTALENLEKGKKQEVRGKLKYFVDGLAKLYPIKGIPPNIDFDKVDVVIENLEKEVEVEEIMELLPNRQTIGECEEQRYIAQALKSKYKITKREDK